MGKLLVDGKAQNSEIVILPENFQLFFLICVFLAAIIVWVGSIYDSNGFGK